jgi:hypothetical protein
MDYLAGQSVGLVKEIKPAAEVITELLEDARRILATLTMERDAAAARARVLNDLPNRLSDKCQYLSVRVGANTWMSVE